MFSFLVYWFCYFSSKYNSLSIYLQFFFHFWVLSIVCVKLWNFYKNKIIGFFSNIFFRLESRFHLTVVSVFFLARTKTVFKYSKNKRLSKNTTAEQTLRLIFITSTISFCSGSKVFWNSKFFFFQLFQSSSFLLVRRIVYFYFFFLSLLPVLVHYSLLFTSIF